MNSPSLAAALGPIFSRVVTSHCWVKQDGKFSHTRRPLTAAKLLHHVNSGPAYGAAQIEPGAKTTLIALLDLDSHKGETPWYEMQGVALTIMAAAAMFGLHAIPFRSSGGKGLHLYFLWDLPQDAYSVRYGLRQVLKHCGYDDGVAGVSRNEIEVFPKQNTVPADGFGNMFVLPLAGLSVPLDAFELDDMPKAYAAEMDWLISAPVPVIERETPVAPSVDSVSVELTVLKTALDTIPNTADDELDYQEWRNVIFGLHHATRGSDEGLALAHEFSARSSKYDPTFLDDRVWPHVRGHYDGEMGAITGRTILHLARARYGWQESVEDDFEVIAVDSDAPGVASWLDGWYFLTARDRLAKVSERGTLSITGFNTRFSRQMPAAKNGKRPPAFEEVKNGPGFPIAADQVYAAGHGPVFEFRGQRFLNAYREAGTPVTANGYTPEGRAAIDRVRAHVRVLCGDDESAHMVESWIALNVRHPGRLIGVALLVKGVQGDGKTILFRNLMAELMGHENVGDIANAEVRSQFSGWAVGSAVRVVEELKAPGHNRHDVLNTVKPYITNQTVSVVRKGQDGFDALNTTNYVCLTNYEDALPIDDTDRRWWVIFSPFASIEEFKALVGDVEPYFDALSTAIRGHSAELRKYFLECAVHVKVRHNMRAPETEGRTRMIRAERDLSGDDFLDAYIAEGEYGISADIIASAELTRRLALDMEGQQPQSRRLTALLASRKFLQCEGPLKWEGKTHRVYVRDTRLVSATSNELGRLRLRRMLDETVKNGDFAVISEPVKNSAEASDLL